MKMNRYFLRGFLCCVGAWFVLMCGAAQAADPVKLPAKEKFLLVALAGQSNMAGRGKVEEQDKVIHPRVLMLNKAGEWVPAVDPVHFDKNGAGVGPGRTFGILLAESDPTITVGLVPTACGGSPISAWVPGGFWEQTNSHPYDDFVARVRRAQKDGVLAAILWHQGEADSGSLKNAEVYGTKLNELIARMRADVGAPEVPLILGQLSKFQENGEWKQPKIVLDKALQDAAAQPNCGFAMSDGLTSNPDKLHFDAASQREFGKRYFAAYQKIVAAHNRK